jgi:hypothetical protein
LLSKPSEHTPSGHCTQSGSQLNTVSPLLQSPSPQTQSVGHDTLLSVFWHTPLPQLKQSRLQSSPTSQKPLQTQSAAHESSSSDGEHTPLPQPGPQSAGHGSFVVQTPLHDDAQSCGQLLAVSLAGLQ